MNKTAKHHLRNSLLPGLAMTLLVTACSQSEAPPPGLPDDTLANVSIVTYMEREAGTDTYPVRILVSPDWVR